MADGSAKEIREIVFSPCSSLKVNGFDEYPLLSYKLTVCHSKTADLSDVTKRADILVSAVGKANFVTAEMVKDGAVVIDVGMNRNAEGKLCGDVDFEAVKDKCSFITPVPGGVGPMTITMLLNNTLTASKNRIK